MSGYCMGYWGRKVLEDGSNVLMDGLKECCVNSDVCKLERELLGRVFEREGVDRNRCTKHRPLNRSRKYVYIL